MATTEKNWGDFRWKTFTTREEASLVQHSSCRTSILKKKKNTGRVIGPPPPPLPIQARIALS